MSDKKYTVIVSDKVKRMLSSNIKFMAQINKKAAINAKNKILDKLNSLSVMPERYPFFNEEFIPKNKYHKMYIENWYLVLYQIKDDKVEINYILDCRQDYSWLFK